MISLEIRMSLTPLQKLPSNVGDLGKIIVAIGLKWLPKVQKIAQSGHTGWRTSMDTDNLLVSPILFVYCFGWQNLR